MLTGSLNCGILVAIFSGGSLALTVTAEAADRYVEAADRYTEVARDNAMMTVIGKDNCYSYPLFYLDEQADARMLWKDKAEGQSTSTSAKSENQA